LKTLTVYSTQRLWVTIAVTLVFAALTALTARITIELAFTPVPITLQTLAVVLSGLVLGARGGAAAQLLYLGLIAIGLPLDSRALGPAALVGPTAGYLVGFVPAAFVTGWLAERLLGTAGCWGNFVAALAGAVTIYLVGVAWLAMMLGNWLQAWQVGVLPFIWLDLIKAMIAAGVAESGRLLLRGRNF